MKTFLLVNRMVGALFQFLAVVRFAHSSWLHKLQTWSFFTSFPLVSFLLRLFSLSFRVLISWALLYFIALQKTSLFLSTGRILNPQSLHSPYSKYFTYNITPRRLDISSCLLRQLSIFRTHKTWPSFPNLRADVIRLFVLLGLPDGISYSHFPTGFSHRVLPQ